MASRIMRKYSVRFRVGEKIEITSKSYLSPKLCDSIGISLINFIAKIRQRYGYSILIFLISGHDLPNLEPEIKSEIDEYLPKGIISLEKFQKKLLNLLDRVELE